MTDPFYSDEQITLHLGDSAQFIRHQILGLDPDVVISDPPDDRATDLAMWQSVREVTDSLHMILNIPYLSDWLHTLRAAGFDFKRAVPWPMQETKHGNYCVLLCHFGHDPGWSAIRGDVDYIPETKFPGERNVDDWRRILSRIPGESFFDPFPGSGSLLVAAADNGRTATGVEIDPRWAEMAADRFRRRAAQHGS